MVKLKNIKIAIIFAISTLVAVCFSLLLVPAISKVQQQEFVPANAATLKDGTEYGFAGGTGTENDPYLIYTAEQLKKMSEFYDIVELANAKFDSVHIKLMKDIYLDKTFLPIVHEAKLSGGTTKPISTKGFAYGTFDGNYHTIEWIASYDTGDSNYEGGNLPQGIAFGLFTAVGEEFRLKNLKLTGSVSIKGHEIGDVGSLIGYSFNSRVEIINCFVDLDIKLEVTNTYSLINPKSQYVGGLIGRIKNEDILGHVDSYSCYIKIINSVYCGDIRISGHLIKGDDGRYFYVEPYIALDKDWKRDIIIENSYADYTYTFLYDYKHFEGKHEVVSGHSGESLGFTDPAPDSTYFNFNTATSSFDACMKNDEFVWYKNPLYNYFAIQKGFVPYYKLTNINTNEYGTGEYFPNIYILDIDEENIHRGSGYVPTDEEMEEDITQFSYSINENNTNTSTIKFYDLHLIRFKYKDTNILPKKGCEYKDYEVLQTLNTNAGDNHIYKGNKIITINFEPEPLTTKIYSNYPEGAVGVPESMSVDYLVTEEFDLYDRCYPEEFKITNPLNKYKVLGYNIDPNATQALTEIHKKPGEVLAEEYYCIWGLVDNGKREVEIYQNYEGADPESISKTYNVNAKVNLLTDFNLTREGYTLLGFATKPTSNNFITQITISKDVARYAYYAIWEEIQYTVKAYQNHNESDTTSIEYKFNSSENINLMQHFYYTREGYELLGFSENRTGETIIHDIDNISRDYTVYAQWKEKIVEPEPGITEYCVTIYQNLSSTDIQNEIKFFEEGSDIVLKEISTYDDDNYNPKYKFIGFSTKQEDTALEYKIEEIENINEHYVIYAQWEKIQYTVKAYQNYEGATPEYVSNKYEKSATVNLLEDFEFTRKGYKFIGFSTRSEDSALERQIDVIYNLDQNYEIYAQWEEIKPITYTITVYQNYNSSDTTKIEQTFNAGETIILKEELAFTRENYTLTGFSESRTGGAVLTKITNISRNYTLYAQWQKIPAQVYTITVYRNYSADDTESETITYKDQDDSFALSSKATLDDLDRSAENYSFVGFATTADGKAESVVIEKGTTGNKKYFCIWEENTKYRITFKASSETDQKEDCLAFVYSGWKIRALLHENPDEVKVSYVIDNTKGETVILYEYKMTSGSPYYFTMESNIEGELIINEDMEICPTQVLREQNITFTYVNDPNIKMSIYVYVDVPGTASVRTEKIKDATCNYTTTYLVRDGMGDSFRGQIGYKYYETTAGHRYRFEVRREPTWSLTGNIIVYYEVPENYKLSYLNRDYTAKDNPAIDYTSDYYAYTSFKDTIALGDEDEIIDHIACCSVIFTPVFTIRPPEVKPVTVNLTFKYNIDHAEMYITDLTQSEPAEVLQTADYTITLDLGVEITTETDIANNRYSYIIGDIKITYVVTEKKYWLKKYNLPGEDWFTSRNEPTWEVNQLHGTDLTIVPIITLKSYEVEVA